jgi:hypothetical protein
MTPDEPLSVPAVARHAHLTTALDFLIDAGIIALTDTADQFA